MSEDTRGHCGNSDKIAGTSDKIVNHLNNGDRVFLDLAKAFDTVPIPILFNFFCNYLIGRTHQVTGTGDRYRKLYER